MAILVCSVYGAVFGTVYPAADRVLSAVYRCLTLPVRAIGCAVRRVKRADAPRPTAHAVEIPFLRHSTDFVFFVLFGIGYLLLSYVLLDGMLRLFAVTFTVGGFVLGYRLIGRRAAALIGRVLEWFDRLLLRIFSCVSMPLVWIGYFLYTRCLRPIAAYARKRYAKRKAKRRKARITRKNKKTNVARSISTKRIWQTFDPLANFMQNNKNAQNVSKILDKNIKK